MLSFRVCRTFCFYSCKSFRSTKVSYFYCPVHLNSRKTLSKSPECEFVSLRPGSTCREPKSIFFLLSAYVLFTFLRFLEHIELNDSHYLVFERAWGNDLFSIIETRKFQPFKEKEAKKIFKQVLSSSFSALCVRKVVTF